MDKEGFEVLWRDYWTRLKQVCQGLTGDGWWWWWWWWWWWKTMYANTFLFMFMVPYIVNLYCNKPTRCSCSQSILYHCRVTLHVSGAFHTHHQEYIKLYLQPVHLYTCTGGCRYSLMYFWLWVWKAPEICRVTLHWNKIDCEQLRLWVHYNIDLRRTELQT